MPGGDVLDRAYPAHYHAYVPPRSGLTRRLIALSRARVASKLARLVPPDGTVLDIGCGTGALLDHIGRAAGGNVRRIGVEYKPEAAAAARARGIETFCGELESAAIADGSVDLAILQHVLEHVRDPIETLRRIAGLLRPGGALAGELPNAGSWDARLFGRLWGGGHAPRHLWHFDPGVLRAALERAGFREIVITPALHTGHWAGSLQHALRRGRRDERGLVSGRAWYYPLLLLATIPASAASMPFNRSGVMRFVARTPGPGETS
jgi:SAM-dependent methyltransferase